MGYPGQMSEQEYTEYRIENALQELRSTDSNLSPFKKDKLEKQIKDDVEYLKQEFTDSYILEDSFDLSY